MMGGADGSVELALDRGSPTAQQLDRFRLYYSLLETLLDFETNSIGTSSELLNCCSNHDLLLEDG